MVFVKSLMSFNCSERKGHFPFALLNMFKIIFIFPFIADKFKR